MIDDLLYHEDLDDRRRFLTLAVREHYTRADGEEIGRVLDRLGGEAAWDAAAAHEVEAIAAHRLMDRGIVPGSGKWKEAHDTAAARMAAFHGELDSIAARLAREGIALVALKNAGISRGLHPCPACCPMGDLDCLVRRDRFMDAHRLFLEAGFRLASRSPLDPADTEHGLATGGCEYFRRAGEQDLWMELQWRPVAGRWIRPDQEPSADDLMERSIPIPGTDVRILAPVDNLIQVALHTAKHSFVRAPGFRLHTDVDRIVARQAPPWDRVIDVAGRLAVRVPVFFSLAIPAGLLATPIPRPVLAALAPDALRQAAIGAWLRRISVFEPLGRKFGRADYVLFTAMLFDDLAGLARAVFPPAEWMARRYRAESLPDLAEAYARRIWDLLANR